MIHVFNCCPCVFLKQWSMPCCAFFTTFSLVMTILILSTDLKVGRHHIQFTSTYLWDFEEVPQESPPLSIIIRDKFIQPPVTSESKKALTVKPSFQIFKAFRKKRFGTFMECGSDGMGDTEWLEEALHWEGLLTQPQPDQFALLKKAQRPRSHLANVCISPTIYPKHAYFKVNSSNNETTAIPCFPLYSLMKAFNTSYLDLLSFKDVTAPIQVLKTLPVGKVRVKAIMIQNSEAGKDEGFEDLCCNSNLTSLLDNWGYKSTSTCSTFEPHCYFICAKTYCPMTART